MDLLPVTVLFSTIFFQGSLTATRETDHFRVKSSRAGDSGTTDYIFSRKPATWDVATKSCKGFQNSRLLSVKSKEESNFILGMINNDDLFDPPLPMGTTFWTSGRYSFKTQSWEWSVKDKAVKFGEWTSELWAEGQPTKPIKETDRVTLQRNNLNHTNWKTLPSTEKAFYVCEF